MGSASHFLTTRCTCRLIRGDARYNFKNEAIANPAALQRLFQLDMLLAAHWARVKRFSYRQPFNSGSKTKPGKKKSYTVQINVARPCNYAVLIGFLSCLHFNLWWCHQPKCIRAFTAKQPATFSYHLFWRSKWIGACLPITWPNQKAGVRTWSVIFFFFLFVFSGNINSCFLEHQSALYITITIVSHHLLALPTTFATTSAQVCRAIRRRCRRLLFIMES